MENGKDDRLIMVGMASTPRPTDTPALSCTPCARGYHRQCAGQTWHRTGTRLAAVLCGCGVCAVAVAA